MRLQISKTKNAESFYVVKSIYVDGKRSNKIVEKLGTLNEIRKKIGPNRDPYEWGRERAAELTRLEQEGLEPDVTIICSPSRQMEKDIQQVYNVGYLILQKVCSELDIAKICREISRNYRFEFSLEQILSRLIYSRVLYPSSKRKTMEFSKEFLEQPGFELQHVYRALEVLSKESENIQQKLYRSSCRICQRNTKVLYYDCTNYYFEIEQEDRFRKYGHSKESRPNPIVQMGLFMDGSGIPLAFHLDPGNTNEQTTLRPLEKTIIKDFGVSDFIVCTDAGLSSTDNRKFNSLQTRSFITTQSVRQMKAYLKDWALDPHGWNLLTEDDNIDISVLDPEHSYDRVYWKERWINDDGIEQRLIVTYSVKYAEYTRALRERQIARAEKLIRSGQKRISRKGQNDVRRFIKATSVTGDGEVAESTRFSLDEDKVAEEAAYDGFYACCTNMEGPVRDILQVIRGRWEIEECFRIMKHEFEARPVYLSREDRINAHFLTCFISLLVYRVLEAKVHEILPAVTVTEIIETLRKMSVVKRRDLYLPIYKRTDLTDAFHEVCGFRTDNEVITAKNMRKILKTSKLQ